MPAKSIERSAPHAHRKRGGARADALVALIVAVTVALFALVLAHSAPALADDVATVAHSEDGTATYSSLDDAWNAALSGTVVVMDADWHQERAFGVPSGKSATLKMNGHKVWRGYNESSGGSVFWLYENSTLNLIGSDKADTEFEVVGLTGLDSRDTFTVTSGGLVTGGHSTNSAGGIEMKEGATLNLTNVAVVGNKAYSTDGGGIHTEGDGCTINLENALVEHNAAAGDGGGVYLGGASSSVIAVNSSISYNTAEDGGGVYVNGKESKVALHEGSKVDHNSAVGSGTSHYGGGGLYFNSSGFTLWGNGSGSVSYNTSTSEHGGGVATANSSNGYVGPTLFEGNKAEGDKGGALYVDSSNVSIDGCTFKSNESAGDGGAVYSAGDKLYLSNCTFMSNSSKANGGALFLDHSDWTIKSSTFSGNSASKRGGAVYVNSNGNRMMSTTITGNTAGLEGGGIYVHYQNNVAMGYAARVYGNTRGPLEDGNADDVFLDDSGAYHAYIDWVIWTGAPASCVGIRTGSTGTRELVRDLGSDYVPGYFFLDLGNSFHIFYDDEDKTVSQIPGAVTHKVTVNGAEVGEYSQGATVTVDGRDYATETQAFCRWNASGSTGLWNASDVLSDYESPVQTLIMPGVDVDLAAVYVDRLASVSIQLDAPTPASALPAAATLTAPDGKQVTASVTWVKATVDGTEEASGPAEFSATYVATITALQKVSDGWAFSLTSDAQTTPTAMGADGANWTHSASVDKLTGTLTVVTRAYTTRDKDLVSIGDIADVEVVAGTASEALAAAVPASVSGTLEDASAVDLALDVDAVDWSACVDAAGASILDAQGRVVEHPDAEQTCSYTVDVPLLSPKGVSIPESLSKASLTVVVSHTDRTVTFDAANGTQATDSSVAWGKAVAKPANPVWEGRSFLGWYVQGSDEKYDFSAPVISDITLEAHWKLLEYKVEFDSDGGTPQPDAQAVSWGSCAQDPGAPTKEGAIFQGWYAQGSSEKYDFSAIVTSNVRLTAHWEPVILTVTFAAEGATPDTQTVSVEWGKTVSGPTTQPTKEGWTLSGWRVEGSEADYDLATPVTSNLTLVAVWTPVTYKVVFQPRNGEASTTVEAVHGQTVAQPDDPTRNGYTFVGWYVADNEPYEFSNPVVQNLRIYAVWEEIDTSRFIDVPEDAWYYPYVTQVARWRIMTGYTDEDGNLTGYFGPEDTLTRAHVATVLWRLLGEPYYHGTEAPFPDVSDPEAYYYEAVAWCKETGIVTGYEAGPNAGRFVPDKPVSREELAVMVYRLAAFVHLDTSDPSPDNFNACEDWRLVSSWAREASVWCAAKGIISGKNTAEGTKRLDPQQGATRAQAAKVFVTLIMVGSEQDPDESAEEALAAVEEAPTFDDTATFDDVEPAEGEQDVADQDEAAGAEQGDVQLVETGVADAGQAGRESVDVGDSARADQSEQADDSAQFDAVATLEAA